MTLNTPADLLNSTTLTGDLRHCTVRSLLSGGGHSSDVVAVALRPSNGTLRPDVVMLTNVVSVPMCFGALGRRERVYGFGSVDSLTMWWKCDTSEAQVRHKSPVFQQVAPEHSDYWMMRKWWAPLESNQACVSARELQPPATPCGLSPLDM